MTVDVGDLGDDEQLESSTSIYGTRRKKSRARSGPVNRGPSNQADAEAYRKRRRSRSPVHEHIVSIKETSHGYLRTKMSENQSTPTLELGDGETVHVNDCVYLVCEPPGEPYYLARVMDFSRLNQHSRTIDAVRVNWFYRPRDIQRHSKDTRYVFATMHSDTVSLHTIRGKCRIEHKVEIADLDQFRKTPDSFYYDKLFDKFMRRQYEIIPISQVINVPEEVKQVLHNRWKYVFVEINRGKELAMDHRACRRCADWCASKDSVQCAHCRSNFHMRCVQPPLPRKPTRGFAWTCTPCSRAEARRLEDNRLPDLDNRGTNEESKVGDSDVSDDSRSVTSHSSLLPHSPIHNVPLDPPLSNPTKEDNLAHDLWPYRYLGIHCNVSDAIDPYDNIYPRAASRIGPKHQAQVMDWPGRPIEYFERVRRPIKRTPKAMKGKRSDERASVETSQVAFQSLAVEQPAHSKSVQSSDASTSLPLLDPSKLLPSQRPAWLMEKPLNYSLRGEDDTVACSWRSSSLTGDAAIDNYLSRTEMIAKRLNLDASSTNFLDAALRLFCQNGNDADVALKLLSKCTRHDLAEPEFSVDELARFEASVSVNGSELKQVAEDVGTKSVAECIRFYYIWKKTAQGAAVWSHSAARRPKPSKTDQRRGSSETQLIDSGDESAYDSDKLKNALQSPICKFCSATKTTRWRCAPNHGSELTCLTVLCNDCAELWRRYAIIFTKSDEQVKKPQEALGKAKKRKIEDEHGKLSNTGGSEIDPKAASDLQAKKIKKIKLKLSGQSRSACEICNEPSGANILTCSRCGLYVHHDCYDIATGDEPQSDWLCDPCIDRQHPGAAQNQTCILCPMQGTSSPSKSVGAMRRTFGHNWAHVTCAIWHDELVFRSMQKSIVIDGIAQLSLSTWHAVCTLCNTNSGACINCSTCGVNVHVECAVRAKFQLGFHVQPIKSSISRRESLPLVRFEAHAGLMVPVLHCAHHDLRRTPITSLRTASAGGEPALQLYMATYKVKSMTRDPETSSAAWTKNTFADILEKRYLEHHCADSKTLKEEMNGTHLTSCSKCRTHYSPYWFSVGSADVQHLCLKCHWMLLHQ